MAQLKGGSYVGGDLTVASTLYASIIQKSGGSQYQFLMADGSVTNTSSFSSSDHTHYNATTYSAGFLPTLSNTSSQYLNGVGTWTVPPNTTYGLATTSSAGLLPMLNNNSSQYLNGVGEWSNVTKLSRDNTIVYGTLGLQFSQYSGLILNNKNENWFHHLVMNHDSVYGYYVDMSFNFASDDVYLRRLSAGELSPHKRFILEGDNEVNQFKQYQLSGAGFSASGDVWVYPNLDNGWVRIAELKKPLDVSGAYGTISITNTSYNNYANPIVFNFQISYREGGLNRIQQIGGTNILYTKARIVYPYQGNSSYNYYIEVYVNSVSINNTYYINLSNSFNVILYDSHVHGSIPTDYYSFEKLFSDDGNATTNSNGFLMKLDGSTSKYLRSDGTWTVPSTSSDNNKYDKTGGTISGYVNITGILSINGLETLSYDDYDSEYLNINPTGGGYGVMIGSETYSNDSDLYVIGNIISSYGIYGKLLNISNSSTLSSSITLGNFSSSSSSSSSSNMTNYGNYISLNVNKGSSGSVTNIGLYSSVGGSNSTSYAGIFMGGRVGIGTTSPICTLEVIGDIKASSVYGLLYGPQIITPQTITTGRSLVLGDNGTLIICNSSSDITIQVPSGVFISGSQIYFKKLGTGNVLFSISSGSIHAADSKNKLTAQYGVCQLLYEGSNLWTLFGNLTV